MNILRKKKYLYLFMVSMAVLLNARLAYATPHSWQPGPWILSIGAGTNITSHLGDSAHFPFNQPIVDTRFNYSPNNTMRVTPFFDIFLGKEWITTFKQTIQFGLGYNQTAAFEANGVFQQGVLPIVSQINNDYKYNVLLKQILVESKWGYLLKKRYRPYLFAGLGAAVNTARNYHAYVPFPNLTRQYTNNTETSFSYSLGLGVDVDLLKNVRLGIGYRFSDSGKAQLGQANILGNNVSGTLSQSHCYTNELLAQLTFVLG